MEIGKVEDGLLDFLNWLSNTIEVLYLYIYLVKIMKVLIERLTRFLLLDLFEELPSPKFGALRGRITGFKLGFRSFLADFN